MSVSVIHGDCVEVLADMEAESFSAIVTDPPAGISFMNRAWDGDKGGRDAWISWMQEIAAECLRVSKPGAHALVWALPRTSHWTAMAWENAGWTVRDRVAHLFGSGFPKSLDVSKAIDKAAGADREVVGRYTHPGRSDDWSAYPSSCAEYEPASTFGRSGSRDITAPATEAARQWQGWGTSLKPAHEPWLLCTKPLPLEAECLTVLLDTANAVFSENPLWQRSSASADAAVSALKCFLPQYARAAANIAPANVRMPNKVSSELARLAAQSFTPSDHGSTEGSRPTVAVNAETQHEADLWSRTVIGEAADSRAAMVTFSSDTKKDTCWSIALSWSDILGDLFDLTRMCITKTKTDPTTELRTLNSALTAAISATTTRSSGIRKNGEPSSVTDVDALLKSARLRLSALVTISAHENASTLASNVGTRGPSTPALGRDVVEELSRSPVQDGDWWLLRKPLDPRPEHVELTPEVLATWEAKRCDHA